MEQSKRKMSGAIAIFVAFSLALAGCSPGSSDSGSEASTVVIDPAEMGDVTLTVLDSFTDSASPIGRWMLDIVAGFEAKYPNIKIQRESVADITTNLKLKLADVKNTPDVVPANQGWAGVGDLSSSGLVLNLDAYDKAYGWSEKLPTTILQQSMASTDGKNIGQGSLFGIPINQGAFVTVFYNRAILKKLGLSVPKTFAEFEAAMAKAKSSGQIPMQLGTQDGWPASATLLALQAALDNSKDIIDAVFATSNVKLADTKLEEAVTAYKKWADSGYFTKDFVGVSSGAAVQDFVDGKGLFVIWYSGFLPFKDQAQGDKFGQFLLPRADGGALTGVGASSQQFSIGANSDAPDAAALFLDYIASQQAGQFAINNTIIPLFGDFKANSNSPMLNDGVDTLNLVTSSNGYLPYFDWATPTMLDVMTQQLQSLFGGKVSPKDVVAAMQKDYDAFRATKK
jgi:raffinose/stachyose/melibiose transport system substrate-binding protein